MNKQSAPITLSDQENRAIKIDRLRYQKNKLSSSFALLAIVFNALYFASIFRTVMADVGDYYFNYKIGLSVIYNLLFMLFVFLSSEGVKNYKMNYSIIVIIIGILQIVRIFYIPMDAHNTTIFVTINAQQVEKLVMEASQFTRVCIYLIASSALLIASGVIAIIKNVWLKIRLKQLSEKV